MTNFPTHGGHYASIKNPSKTDRMIATLRKTDGRERVIVVPPGEELVTVGDVHWPLWTLEWKRPRVGLCRFGRRA